LLVRCWMIIAFLLVTSCAAADELPFSIAVYRSGDIRLDNLSNLRSYGFDGYYFNGHWGYEYTSPGWHQRNFPPWAEACAENNITFIAGQYWSWGGKTNFSYSTAVDQFGNVEAHIASPVSSVWWEKIVRDGAVCIARLSLEYPIWGIIWDMDCTRGCPRSRRRRTGRMTCIWQGSSIWPTK
jgi:hypothetical protein